MVSWLSVELSKLECVSLTTLLNPRDSWVIDDEQPLLIPTRNILLTLIMVDSKSISKRVRSKHKRTRTIVKNLSVGDCFLIMDHVVEKDKFSDGVNENFYKVLSKSGLTATTTMDIKSKVSYIDRSRDYKLFTRPVHKILTKSSLYKLQNYFASNQRFSVDKKKHPIKLAVIPPETTMMDLPDQWTVNANVKELLHQLSSILYRCRDGANFSKRNRNNLSFNKLYKLFDWDVYQCEQHQCTSMSVLERNLHQKHKDTYSQHTQTHKSIGKDGVVETLFPDPHYTAETHMPLSTTPQLDLYFTQSKLTTVSLLLTACVEHTCRRQSEYCLLHFESRPFTCPTTTKEEQQCFNEKDSPSKKKKKKKNNTTTTVQEKQ